MAILVGNIARFDVTFKDENGTAQDPTTVVFKLLDSARVAIVTYTYGTDAQLLRLAQGQYRVNYTTTVPGEFTGGFEGTGALVVECEANLQVIASVFYAGVCP